MVFSPPFTKHFNTISFSKGVYTCPNLCLWPNKKIASWLDLEIFQNTIDHIQMFGHRGNLKCPYNQQPLVLHGCSLNDHKIAKFIMGYFMKNIGSLMGFEITGTDNSLILIFKALILKYFKDHNRWLFNI
jgi:hypothetical protein